MTVFVFEWDEVKDTANQRDHGVRFVDAQEAFYDPNRLIAKDEAHSKHEDRLYCIGKTAKGILTVRFTLRGHRIRIIGAGNWRKWRKLYEETQK